MLFYSATGSIEDSTLALTVVDFFVLDVGDSAYTEYEITPEASTYMIDNNLLDYKIGLIHSHHQMSTFFSGTDTSTLREKGSNTNIFLSLIVNNSGTYSACITRKIEERVIGKKIKTFSSFTLNDKTIEEEDIDFSRVVEVEYYNLNIIIEGKSPVNEEITSRYNELIARKNVKPNISTEPSLFDKPTIAGTASKEETSKKSLVENIEEAFSVTDNIELLDYHIDNDIKDAALGQLLFGCITFTASGYRKQDTDKWVTENMEKALAKRFPGISDYEKYIETVVDIICTSTTDTNLENALIGDGYTSFEAHSAITQIIAKDLIIELEELSKKKSNIYIDAIITSLLDFIYG